MSDRFDETIGGTEGIDPAELARLRHVHELLLEVGPPPELPVDLAEPPTPAEVVRLVPRRRRGALALLAAALALALFGAGYLVGGRNNAVAPVATIPLAGVGDGAGAFASIELLPEDASGNWPMNLRIRGLEPSVGRTDSYELWLARDGRLTRLCGVFTVHTGVTEVQLSVPYRLRGLDWVVTRSGSKQPLLAT